MRLTRTKGSINDNITHPSSRHESKAVFPLSLTNRTHVLLIFTMVFGPANCSIAPASVPSDAGIAGPGVSRPPLFPLQLLGPGPQALSITNRATDERTEDRGREAVSPKKNLS